jgi:hypothetical protein
MKKVYLFTILALMACGASFAQKKAEAVELNCYNKWAVKFEERGAEDVKDGVYTDVIVTFRAGPKADCFSGKAEVLDGKLIHFYTENVQGEFTRVDKQWKPTSPKDITIVNGISTTMITNNNELINVIWPNKLKAKKPALKRAPEPTDD